jgi:N-acetylglucosaminyldiphosphoundecaprenol N-acetyl-beta-D-mannosaminyltransferase
MSKKIQILNLQINSITKDLLMQNLIGVVFTPNVDHLMKLQKDKEFYDCYLEADWIICDSKIVSLASKFLVQPIKEVIPGSEFFPIYCHQIAANPLNDKRIFLLGGSKDEITKKAKERLLEESTFNFISGYYCPPFGFENDPLEIKKIIDLISKSRANVLAVGVGAPKQEKFIISIKDKLPHVDTYFAIGATIDFISGELKRAPKWIQKIGFEWAYRMFQDPKRLIRRYLIDDLPFFYLIIKQKIGTYNNPFG